MPSKRFAGLQKCGKIARGIDLQRGLPPSHSDSGSCGKLGQHVQIRGEFTTSGCLVGFAERMSELCQVCF